MLDVEIAIQQVGKEEVAAQQADVQVMPNTPPGRKRTHTLVERTLGKPLTPPRAAPAPDPSESHYLPLSTAPAVLYKGKGGKERKRTTKAAKSKTRGYLPESQPRECVETKTIPAFYDVYSCSSLPRLDSPPTNALLTFQQNEGLWEGLTLS
jgi:hypothetical protein